MPTQPIARIIAWVFRRVVVFLLPCGGAFASDGGIPPLVLHNATIYTVDKANPRANAVLAENGLITYAGTSTEALRRAPGNARRIDLKGATVFPGLTDAHAHLAGIGFRELEFNLQGTTSLEDWIPSLGVVTRDSTRGDLVIKIPEGDTSLSIIEVDREDSDRHQKRWPCSPQLSPGLRPLHARPGKSRGAHAPSRGRPAFHRG